MEKKPIWEIFLTPLAVAFVGIVGTMLVTNSQIKASITIAQAQQKIKIIEIFSDKITNGNEAERILAIEILRAVDSELAEQIASAIVDTDLDVTRDIDGMQSSVALEVKAEIKKENKMSTADRSQYLVGYFALNVSTELYNDVLNNLTDSGYTMVTDSLLFERPGWFSSSSAVLYYSSLSEEEAENIAKQLTKVTETEFEVLRGKGVGVPKGQEDQRLYIHFVK